MTDWRDTPRAAIKGQVNDFDTYNPIRSGYEDVFADGAIDAPLAAAVARFARITMGVSVEGVAYEKLKLHINAWLRNLALGAPADESYRALMDAFQAQLPSARDIEASMASQAGAEDFVCPACHRRQHCDERCDEVDREMARLFR